MFVFRVFDRVSYALVLNTTDPGRRRQLRPQSLARRFRAARSRPAARQPTRRRVPAHERRFPRRGVGAAPALGSRSPPAGRAAARLRLARRRARGDTRAAPPARHSQRCGAPRRAAGCGAPREHARVAARTGARPRRLGRSGLSAPRSSKSAIRRRCSIAWGGASFSRARRSRSSAAATQRRRVAPMPKRSPPRCPPPASPSSADSRSASMRPRIAADSPAPAAASRSSAPVPTASIPRAIAISRTSSRRAASCSPNSRSAHRR